MSFLTLEGVGKTYHSGSVDVKALEDVSFSLEDGEFVVVLGSSGAGKTTLLNLLGGMDDATEGKIVLGRKDDAFELARRHGRRHGGQDRSRRPRSDGAR